MEQHVVCLGLFILTILSLSSQRVYVRTGLYIANCTMKCPQSNGLLELYRYCENQPFSLLDMDCDQMKINNYFESRLLYNTSSGCWNLTNAIKNDSCVYETNFTVGDKKTSHSADITVLDPVLISNITTYSSRLGQDIAVSVQFSGEETSVTWEVDGGPLPDRYWLIDDNRTLIIPIAQRDDAERTLRVRITNPVSEDTQKYRLEVTDSETEPYKWVSTRIIASSVAAIVGACALLGLLIFYLIRRRTRQREFQPAQVMDVMDHSSD